MKYKLQDLIDIEQFQALQDRLNSIYAFPSAIVDKEGNILTTTAWQDICTKFHRAHPECEKECIKSDQHIIDHLSEADPAITYICPHGLVDNAFPIMINGEHLGSFFTGQFFLEDPDMEFFRLQARKYGFDEEEYLNAVRKAPIWNRKQLDDYLTYIKGLIEIISSVAHKKLRDNVAAEQIEQSEQRYRMVLETSMDGYLQVDLEGRLLEANQAYCRMSGYTSEELVSMSVSDVDGIDTPADTRERIKFLYEKGQARFETRHRRKDGSLFDAEVSAQCHPIYKDRIVAFIRDITRQKQTDSELKLKSLVVDQIQDHVTITDLNGKITFINQVESITLKRSREEILGQSVSLYGENPEQGATQNEIIQNTLEDGAWRGEVVNYDSAGNAIVMDCRTSVVHDDKGEPIALCGISTDITGRKQAEQALQESEENYRILFDHAGDAIFIHDAEGRILAVNEMACAHYGYSRDALLGLSIGQIDTPLESLKAPERISQLMSRGELQFETEHQLKDGTVITVDVKARKIHWRNQPVMMSVCRDITERKKTETALKDRERTLDNLIANLPGFIYRCNNDKDWTMSYVSDGCREVTGYEPEDFIGNRVIAYNDIIPFEYQEIIWNKWQGILKNRGYFREEYPIITRQGEQRWVWERGQGIFDENGTLLFLEGFVTDITDSIKAEEEKEKLRAQLVQAQKMESVGRLAGGVAHDFNNMLMAILGHAELARLETEPGSSMHENLSDIMTAAQRSADLTRQLLAFARKQTIDPKPLNLNDTIEGMLKMLRRLIGEDIHLVWKPCNDLWQVKVDPAQIDQLLANLLVNARDAIQGNGKVSIETGNCAFDLACCAKQIGFIPGEFVMISVSDNGSGMEMETLEHIFEPFYTTKELGQGTGLGLATVYGIVKQNHGFINVTSEPGRGSTFTIYLPRCISEIHAETPSLALQQIPFGNETILFVEDDPLILDLGKAMLLRLGYKVFSAGSPTGAIALAKAHAGKIDLLISDVVMPEMDGRSLSEEIIRISPSTKRLFISGYSSSVIAHHGILDEGVMFIEKPFTLEKIACKVRETLEKKD